MVGKARCFDNDCSCEAVVLRTYRDLRDKGCTDRDAFLSTVRVLELRHPGHDRNYYFLQIANWLGCEPSVADQ
jgi:hypothetical protein